MNDDETPADDELAYAEEVAEVNALIRAGLAEARDG